MPLMTFNGVLDVIEHRVIHVLTPESLQLSLAADTSRCARTTLQGARAVLYAPHSDVRSRDAVWRQAVVAAQREREAAAGSDARADGPAQTFVVWLAVPSIRRVARRVSARLGLERQDAEAELMAALLEIAATVDAERHDLAGVLLRGMCGPVWALARQGMRETPVGDVAVVRAAADGDRDGPPDPGAFTEDQWEVTVAPPPRPDGLSASIRFTVSAAARVEEQRRESLARRLGLEDIVHRARRPSEGPPIGRLLLRPAGARR